MCCTALHCVTQYLGSGSALHKQLLTVNYEVDEEHWPLTFNAVEHLQPQTYS